MNKPYVVVSFEDFEPHARGNDIPDVKVEDDVVLIGKQKNNTITIRSFTEITNAINNVLVSRLPTAIPRRSAR
ncbi:MAG: hypothetical protein EA363_10455 [Balneolaceae bacterium]|nr:MAG: hypothetical protein EA363_10455 [Balneolaceae bacterium]